MSVEILKRSGWFVGLAITQVLVFNNIHLFGVATPLLYVYFIVTLPLNYPKWASLLWAFALGLVVDVFANTPGVTASTLTLVAAIQPYFLQLFVPRDAPEDITAAPRAIGFTRFYFYAFTLTLLQCLLFFTVEMFSFHDWLLWLECVGASTLLTFILLATLESVSKR